MRFKHTVVVLLIAIVATPAMPVTGQEEPLPVIQAKSTFEPLTPFVALAVEPIRDLTPRASLADAARANDYAAFDALYRAEPSPAYAMLHELWTFSMTDPTGAFYGQETYARLARAYPGFARYIDEYRIVDSNGNVFYPSSETRAFLLDRAVEGRVRTAPRVQVASETAPTPSSVPAERAPRRRAPAVKVQVAQVAQPASVQAAAQDAAAAAVVSAGEDAAVPVNAVPVAQPAPKRVAAAPPAAGNDLATRGIFLLLIGIFGIGILALMLRTPREVPASILTQSAPPPVTRPSAVPPPQPLPTPTEKNRASGSHG